MENLAKYDQAFIDTFAVKKEQLSELKYQDVKEWDSIGHMNLMVVLEDGFNIEMDIDDITDFSSYSHGKVVVKKYGVEL